MSDFVRETLAPYKLIIELVLLGALAGFVALQVHRFLDHERDLGRQEVQAKWDAQKRIDQDAAARQVQFWRDRYTEAINQGAKNAQINQAAAAAATTAAGSLRDALDALRQRLPGSSAEASRAYAATLATLLTACEGEYRAVAQDADGHANDSATLDAAFPQQNKLESRK